MSSFSSRFLLMSLFSFNFIASVNVQAAGAEAASAAGAGGGGCNNLPTMTADPQQKKAACKLLRLLAANPGDESIAHQLAPHFAFMLEAAKDAEVSFSELDLGNIIDTSPLVREAACNHLEKKGIDDIDDIDHIVIGKLLDHVADPKVKEFAVKNIVEILGHAQQGDSFMFSCVENLIKNDETIRTAACNQLPAMIEAPQREKAAYRLLEILARNLRLLAANPDDESIARQLAPHFAFMLKGAKDAEVSFSVFDLGNIIGASPLVREAACNHLEEKGIDDIDDIVIRKLLEHVADPKVKEFVGNNIVKILGHAQQGDSSMLYCVENLIVNDETIRTAACNQLPTMIADPQRKKAACRLLRLLAANPDDESIGKLAPHFAFMLEAAKDAEVSFSGFDLGNIIDASPLVREAACNHLEEKGIDDIVIRKLLDHVADHKVKAFVDKNIVKILGHAQQGDSFILFLAVKNLIKNNETIRTAAFNQLPAMTADPQQKKAAYSLLEILAENLRLLAANPDDESIGKLAPHFAFMLEAAKDAEVSFSGF
ncbi:MAG: hypothetical protein PVJ92_02845, partial [Candidatus Dependentiae bacterium]